MLKSARPTTAARPARQDGPQGPSWRYWLALLLGLRLLTALIGALLSRAAPISAVEKQLPLSGDLGPATWLYRALVLPWLRWDTQHYVNIVARGYRTDDGSAAFHPLYPWLAELPVLLGGGMVLLGLLIVSTLAALGLALATERLALLDLEPAAARRATLLVLLAPPSFILLAAYPEGLFLLFAALTLLLSRRRRWWLAGLAGFCATLTRQQGIALALPMIWEMVDAAGGWRAAARRVGWWLAAGLPPFGLVAYGIYRALTLDDANLDPSRPETLLFGLLVSSSARDVVPGQRFLPPPVALWQALETLATSPSMQLSIDLLLGMLLLTLLIAGWRHLRPSYRAYGVAIALLSFAYQSGQVYPYMGLPRHMLLALPIFFPLGAWAATRRRLQPVLLGSFLCYLFLTMLFFLEAWVP